MPDRSGTALAPAVGLAFPDRLLRAVYRRRLPRRPEDDPEADIEEGTGELGFFPARTAGGRCSWVSPVRSPLSA